MIKTRAKTVLVAVSRVVYNRPRPNDNIAKACYVLKIQFSPRMSPDMRFINFLRDRIFKAKDFIRQKRKNYDYFDFRQGNVNV